MDKKSKVLLTIVVIALIVSVGITFYKTVILGDFEVVSSEEDGGEELTEE